MSGTALKERAKIENDSSNDYVLKKPHYTTSWSPKKSIQLDKAVQRSYLVTQLFSTSSNPAITISSHSHPK